MRTAFGEEWLAKDVREVAAWTTLGVISAFLLSGVWFAWLAVRWTVGR